MALKHMLPIILLNFIMNVMLNMIKAAFFIKRNYHAEGLTIALFAKACISLLASFFPVFALSTFNSPSPKICRCESPGFEDDLVKLITARERQKFLRNLQL
jgi:hypothetical protein